MLHVVALIAGGVAILATVLSLLRAKWWWVRIWDFPRLQLALLGLAALALWVLAGSWAESEGLAFTGALGASVAYQAAMVWRYTPLAPREVQRARDGDPARQLSLVFSNVLQTNRQADRVLAALRAADADLVLCVETDDWWQARLDALAATHPHAVRCALPNTYGMLLYSRLALEDARVEFLVERDIPSIQATVRLRNGQPVWLNCVHPRPPAPGESDESVERDAELLLVGRRVCGATVPVVVCGDLNDVAWSRTTRLFQKVSRLVDPRKGRGFFGTFHARYPGFRYPLDHVFHSEDFRFVALRRLGYVGSDHFPVYAALSYEPQAAAEQEAPAESGADAREAHETIARGQSRRG
jgi:endonuclease/exonuclease/phosphatase (EEP) superfamily protein YafD